MAVRVLVTLLALAKPARLLAENPDDPHHSGIAIAAAMRAWQERFAVIADTSLSLPGMPPDPDTLPPQWPANADGEAAKPFPEDRFYCKDLESDDSAAKLVQALATEMVRFRTIPGRGYIGVGGTAIDYRLPYLANFIVTPITGELEALGSFSSVADLVFTRDPVNFLVYSETLPSDSPFHGITRENYREKFTAICDYIAMLDTALILYANNSDITANYRPTLAPSAVVTSTDSEAGETSQMVADRALAEYRSQAAAGELRGLLSATPRFDIRAEQIGDPNSTPKYSVTVASSSGYFVLDRTKSPWSERLAGHKVDFYVRRTDFEPARVAEVNYPPMLSARFQHVGIAGSSAVFETPVFSAPSHTAVSVDGVGAQVLPLRAGWSLEPFLVVRDGWIYPVDHLEGECACANCENGDCFGPEGTPKLNSVEITVSLGEDAEGSLGALKVMSERPSPLLARPEGLIRAISRGVRSFVDYSTVNGPVPEVHTLPGGTGQVVGRFDPSVDPDALSRQRRPLKQLQADAWIATVVGLGTNGYRLDFVRRAGLPDADPDTGLVDATGAAPFRSFAFSFDDGDTHRLRFTRSEPGVPDREFLYTFEPANQTWTLHSGVGPDARAESVRREDDGDEWTDLRTLRGADGAAVSEELLRYRTFPWNDGLSRFRSLRGDLVEKILDPSGEARSTRYRYYSDPGVDRAAYGKVRVIEYADRSWVRYEYDTQSGELTRTIRPWADAGPDSPEAECRVAIEEKGALADVDGDGVPEIHETSIERTLGLETARSHRVQFSKVVSIGGYDLVREVQSQAVEPGAAWDDPASLRTETRRHVRGLDAGKVHSVIFPDGTMMFTRYERHDGHLTTTMESGEPDSTFGRILRGTRTVIVTHPEGATQSHSVHDIESSLLLELAETPDQDFDESGRPTLVLHLDGTAEQFDYSCCGLDRFEDRTGTVETYGYDSLRRRTSTTRAGLTSISMFDAAGRIVETRQRSRDDQVRTTSRSEYTLGGRLVAMRDLLDRRTSFAEVADAQGRTLRTTTRPDLTTRIETILRDGRVVEVGGTGEHPIAYEYEVVTDTHDGRTFHAGVVTTVRLGAQGERTEWERTYTDMVGRTYKVEVPSYSGVGTDATVSFFNNKGQLIRQRTAEGVTTLFAYDSEGRLRDTALDVNANGAIDFAGVDRITRTTVAVVQDPERGVLRRTSTSAWLTLGDAADTLVSEAETNAATRTIWSRTWGRESRSRTELPGAGEVRQIVRGPDGVVSTTTSIDGFATDRSVVNAAGERLAHTTFRYDSWGRQEASIDARNGETTVTYDAGDRTRTVTSAAPDATQPRQTTVFGFDVLDRVISLTLPDGAVQHRAYYPTGETHREWGARQYPVEYRYDAQGRLEALTTWQDYAGNAGAATTGWRYHPVRGTLERKTYADGSHVEYTYTSGGRVKTRLWARGALTTYVYDPATGDLSEVDYSDATADASFTYDRAGRMAGRSDGTGACEYQYTHDAITTETHTAGLLAGFSLVRGHDLGRLGSLSVQGQSGSIYDVSYGYRDAEGRDVGRLASVTSAAARVDYVYEPDSQLLRETRWSAGSTERVRATTLFDRMNRLVSRTTSQGPGPAIRAFAYGYNAANQRQQATLETGESWKYHYDELGQVTVGVKRTATDQVIPGYELGYAFDDIGNRRSTTTNGRTARYHVNLLNQYDERDVPRVIDVLGQAPDAAAIEVNGLASIRTERPGSDGYFFTPYPASSAGATDLNVRSKVPGSPDQVFDEPRRAYLAQSPESYQHDADGNLTDDWRWHYTWDGENRLAAMETQAAAVALGVPRQRLEFGYDGQGRRISKKVHARDQASGLWSVTEDRRFIYDGWNLIADFLFEASTSTFHLNATYTWGSDLSGSLQGAGGVGGLLWATTASATAIPAYDGNGNVVAYVDLDTAEPIAEFEYGPFGETLRATGPFGPQAAFRFSTKFTDRETDLVYYGFRYYNPSTGRWLSRDPIQENGGVNLHEFIRNDVVGGVDALGLAGFFFDGTNNNRDIDVWGGSGNAPTNVSIFFDLSQDPRRHYYEGVGTGPEIDLAGLMIGAGGQERLQRAMEHWKADYRSGDRTVDIFGFSRGAAIAREFANRIAECYPDAKVRFIGIFDTVAQFGAPDDGNYNKNIRLQIPESVGFTAHAVARHEYRTLFPLTSIRDTAGHQQINGISVNYSVVANGSMSSSSYGNAIEQAFDGAHSDIGGGYQDGRNMTALYWMWGLARAKGVPLNYLSNHPDFAHLKHIAAPHESRDNWMYRQDFIRNFQKERRVYRPGP